jgi:mRNA interferase HicA
MWRMTWAELIRLLKAHGFEELRTGKGSHRQFWNLSTKRVVTIAVHTEKDVGTGLLNRILKDAGVKESKH